MHRGITCSVCTAPPMIPTPVSHTPGMYLFQSKKHHLKGKDSSDKVRIWKKNLKDHFKAAKSQNRSPSSSFMHTSCAVEQKIGHMEGLLLGMCFFRERQTSSKPDALSHSGGSICHCNCLHQENVRSYAPLPRCTAEGSLALLLGLFSQVPSSS